MDDDVDVVVRFDDEEETGRENRDGSRWVEREEMEIWIGESGGRSGRIGFLFSWENEHKEEEEEDEEAEEEREGEEVWGTRTEKNRMGWGCTISRSSKEKGLRICLCIIIVGIFMQGLDNNELDIIGIGDNIVLNDKHEKKKLGEGKEAQGN